MWLSAGGFSGEGRICRARADEAIAEIAAWTAERGRPAILCGTVMPATSPAGKQVRNVAVLLRGGKVSFVQQKMLLPFYDVFDEQRYFEPACAAGVDLCGWRAAGDYYSVRMRGTIRASGRVRCIASIRSRA